MRCAIMQPTYLPWAGYFNLACSVDIFVLLDDVQFERRSWQSRNRILMNGRPVYLTVPVKKNSQTAIIGDIDVLENVDWRAAHWKTLCTSYSKAPGGIFVLDLLECHYKGPLIVKLADFNISIFKRLIEVLGIDVKIIKASQLVCDGKRADHLYKIAKALDCDEYLSPVGSMSYLFADGFNLHDDIKLSFQEFTPTPYKHYGCDHFLSSLSIVDVIANLGIEAASKYVRNFSD